nr:kinesin-like protein KIN-7N [Onthophagus taurus]
MSQESIKVAIRASNPIKKDHPKLKSSGWVLHENTIQPLNESVPKDGYPKDFDLVFDADVSNKQVYESFVAPIVASSIEGYNGAVFTYGATSTAKWFTMDGTIQDSGMILRSIEDVFKSIKKLRNGNYLVRCGYILIHNNKVYDLLKYTGNEIKITNAGSGQLTFGAREAVVSTKIQAVDLFYLGLRNRMMYIQNCNFNIKHCNLIFRINIEHEIKEENDTKFASAHLNLVTLSGSERVSRPAHSRRFTERDYTNKYMSMFASTIENKINNEPVNYNDSILTMLCRNAIGGNAKTAFIACFTNTSVENTHFTLNFAHKLRKIENFTTLNITGQHSVIREITLQVDEIEKNIDDIKFSCAPLSTVGVVMQTIDLLHDRIKLLESVFVKGDAFEETEHDFSTLQINATQLSCSSLELRILNVFLANMTFRIEHIGNKIKLPFELLYFTLSIEAGNEFISNTPENFLEDLNVIDYLHKIDPEDHLELPISDDETDVSTDQDTIDIDVSPLTSEFSALERSIHSQIQNEELRAELNNLSSIFHLRLAEQYTINSNAKAKNKELLQKFAALKNKYANEEAENNISTARLETVERELALRKAPVQGDIRKQYDLLLLEADKKDMEYFSVKREKDELEKQVYELSTTLELCKSAKLAGKSCKKLTATESTLRLLQSEIQDLNQRLAEQDSIMEEMTMKHKHREDDLLKRVHDREAPHERSFISVPSAEKEIQATPSSEDVVAQTEKEYKLSLNVCLQTTPYFEPVVEVKETEIQTDKKVAENVATQTQKCVIIPRSSSKPDLAPVSENSQEYNTVKFSTSQATIRSTSSIDPVTGETLSPIEEECLVDLRRCDVMMEDNKSLLRNVNRLHVDYIKEIGKHTDRDSALHEEMRMKEEDLFRVKSSLQTIIEKLRNSSNELFKMKERRASYRVCASKSQILQTLQITDCESCSELTGKLKRLEKKVSELELSEPLEKSRERMNVIRMDVNKLQKESNELNEKYIKLKEEYVIALLMIESQSEESQQTDKD